jgi:hypothetical protein
VTPGSIAVVICDGAGWHQRGKELIVPDNIRLLRRDHTRRNRTDYDLTGMMGYLWVA